MLLWVTEKWPDRSGDRTRDADRTYALAREVRPGLTHRGWLVAVNPRRTEPAINLVQVRLGRKVGRDGLGTFAAFRTVLLCKNWCENLLLFSTRKPRLCRKNPTVKFGALAGYPSPFLPTFLSYFRAFFRMHRYFQPLERWTWIKSKPASTFGFYPIHAEIFIPYTSAGLRAKWWSGKRA
jgi:hypothetical protein